MEPLLGFHVSFQECSRPANAMYDQKLASLETLEGRSVGFRAIGQSIRESNFQKVRCEDICPSRSFPNKPSHYLEGHGDSVSRFINPISHINPAILHIINLLTKSP